MTVQESLEIYNAGFEAQRAGASRDTCPHTECEARWEWLEGWDHAANQKYHAPVHMGQVP